LTFLIASGFMTSLCYSSLCTSMFFHSLILVHLLFIFRKIKNPKNNILQNQSLSRYQDNYLI
jgi:hypothetical protein